MANSILDRIRRGGGETAYRHLLTGTEGVGKSTWASKAPNPVFIAPEDGLTGLDHVKRFSPESLDDIHLLLDAFIEKIEYKNIVIDTSDWLERLIATSICARDDKKDIEDYGYGKGYTLLEGEMVKILAKLDTIRTTHKVGIIVLAHVQIRTFNDPATSTSYDRFEMKGNKKFTGLLREWPDACLFARIEVFKKKVKGQQKDAAIPGERIVHTQWSPGWDAKNRLGLPETLPLEWEDYERAIKENSVPALIEKVKAAYKLATKIPEADKPRWEKGIKNLESMTSDKLKSAIEKLESLK